MGDERREFSRVAMALTGELSLAGQTVRGTVEDLSMNGVFLRTGQAHAGLRGQEGDLRLTFGEGDQVIHILGRAQVMREVGDGLGLRIAEVELESYHHLRALVLHNAESFDVARAEIEAHQGLRRK